MATAQIETEVGDLKSALSEYLEVSARFELGPVFGPENKSLRELRDSTQNALRGVIVELFHVIKRHPEFEPVVQGILRPLDEMMAKLRADRRRKAKVLKEAKKANIEKSAEESNEKAGAVNTVSAKASQEEKTEVTQVKAPTSATAIAAAKPTDKMELANSTRPAKKAMRPRKKTKRLSKVEATLRTAGRSEYGARRPVRSAHPASLSPSGAQSEVRTTVAGANEPNMSNLEPPSPSTPNLDKIQMRIAQIDALANQVLQAKATFTESAPESAKRETTVEALQRCASNEAKDDHPAETERPTGGDEACPLMDLSTADKYRTLQAWMTTLSDTAVPEAPDIETDAGTHDTELMDHEKTADDASSLATEPRSRESESKTSDNGASDYIFAEEFARVGLRPEDFYDIEDDEEDLFDEDEDFDEEDPTQSDV